MSVSSELSDKTKLALAEEALQFARLRIRELEEDAQRLLRQIQELRIAASVQRDNGDAKMSALLLSDSAEEK